MTTTADVWTNKTPDPLCQRHEATLAGFMCWANDFGTFATWNVFGEFAGVGSVMFSGRERTAELAKARCGAAVMWLQQQGAKP